MEAELFPRYLSAEPRTPHLEVVLCSARGVMPQPPSPIVERPSRAMTPATDAPRRSARRILCVFPRYEPSLGSFHYAYDITGDLRAFMPPQGLLVIAASLPAHWKVRFVDENVAPAKPED